MECYSLLAVVSDDEASQRVLRNLTKMYCYEWSQYIGLDVNESGCFAFEKYLPSYWQNADRKAFLLCHETDPTASHWAGFALLDRDFLLHPDYDYSMAEFFVMYKYRCRGAGTWMARTLFDRFPGKWELGRNPRNLPSVSFWDKVIFQYTGGKFELVRSSPAHVFIDGTLGDVFSFDNSKPAK